MHVGAESGMGDMDWEVWDISEKVDGLAYRKLVEPGSGHDLAYIHRFYNKELTI